MNPKLQHKFDQIENDRIKLMMMLRGYPETVLNYKPNSGQWSVNQILIHLFTSEQLTLNYLKKKSLGVDQLGYSGLVEELKMILLRISQRLPLRFKAPELVVKNTPPPLSVTELTGQWNSLRLEFKNFLETIEAENLGKLVYKHPIAGRFNVIQCVAFMREHFQHHLPQIKRALRAITK